MHLSSYTFIALDLETTGLSFEKDTIIEVAAVKFQLERENDIFRIANREERSMLIDPEREIDEHISMITGISSEMVKGKLKWHEVRERVANFIGKDTIIVGHNVLFDITMLESHGINLNHHRVLDTFELSELFSTDAESLNLGFLAKKYGFDDGSEHRALDDTKLSIKLFLYYLEQIQHLDQSLLDLWKYARLRDESLAIDTLLGIVGEDEGKIQWSDKKLEFSLEDDVIKPENYPNRQYNIVSLSPFWEDEKKIINQSIALGKTLILTSSKKQSEWVKEKMEKDSKVILVRERGSYISLQMLDAWVKKTHWNRKETILVLRLIHWLFITKEGNIDELKWYGDEIYYKYLFRLGSNEKNSFFTNTMKMRERAQILITEHDNIDLKNFRIDNSIKNCIIRDVGELESGLRYRDSITIDWSEIRRDLAFCDCFDTASISEIEYALSILEDIVTSVVVRPVGPNPIPPGEYGETYFFTQKELWHRGYIWLIFAAQKLENALYNITKVEGSYGVIEKTMYKKLKSVLEQLIRLAKVGNPHGNIVLEIKNNRTRITLTEREKKNEIQELLSMQGGLKNIFLGYKISAPSIKKFLIEECGLSGTGFEHTDDGVKISTLALKPVIKGDKVVILGTNLKNLRNLGRSLKSTYEEYEIFTQGISGGKSKMLHLFLKSKKSILIGLIHTWKDESILWEDAETVSITKIPFDPPNDAHYLARTVGLSNNFELYSIPMAIQTINTTIGRIISSRKNTEIYITDEKITTMTWGKDILKEIL